jgi:hypothetical protein
MIAAAIALLLAAPSLDVDLALRAETRGSRLVPSSLPAGESTTPSERLAAELTPTVGLTVGSQSWRFQAGYSPRLWDFDLGGGGRTHLDHRLVWRSRAAPAPRWLLSMNGYALKAILDPLADPWTDFAVVQSLQRAQRPQNYQAIRADVGSEVRLGPRSFVTVAAAAGVAGGTDAYSRLALPTQRTAAGSFVIQQSIGARNLIGLTAEGTVTRTYPGQTVISESAFVFSAARYERSFDRFTEGWLAAGASFTREASTVQLTVERVAPGGELGLQHRSRSAGPSYRATVRVAPEIDRATGQARNSLGGAATLAWPFPPHWVLTGGANAIRALGPGDVIAGLGFDLALSRSLEGGMSIQAGVRSRWQRDQRTPLGSYFESGFFLAYDWLVRAPPPNPETSRAGAGDTP